MRLSRCETVDGKGPFIFYEVGGAGGIFWSVIKKLHDPPQVINFFPMTSSNKGNFFRWRDFSKKSWL